MGDGHARASVEHGARERETNLKNALAAPMLFCVNQKMLEE